MNCTKIDQSRKTLLQNILQQYPPVVEIIKQITQHKGRALLVGGAVRDLLLGLPFKDLDIEVHGIPLDELQKILEQFGHVKLVGKSFGVLRLCSTHPHPEEHREMRLEGDWSLPRSDSSGRHPEVNIDPYMKIEDAFKRRDLTINAMGIDLSTDELVDPWGGCADLQKGILRAPDAALFKEDPLRLFRVMQFIGRFGFTPDKELNDLCAHMDLSTISVERIESEFDKLLLKSAQPSLGLRWLEKIGRLKEIFPELHATVGIKQEHDWHPEGDVFEHSMQAIDAGAQLSYESPEQKLIALFALMCHDLGKVSTTHLIDGRLRSHGHEEAGVPLAKSLLKRITRRVDLIHAVEKLVRHHMAPGQFPKNNAKLPAYKRLATKLAPDVSMELLARISLADKRGRNPESNKPLIKDVPEVEQFLQMAQKANVVYKPEEPLLLGRDLEGKVEPGPKMGKLLKEAYEIQIDEGIADKVELLKRVLSTKE
ncbi:CCA tRNA nucleotidyltransferase [soil metagenome]